MKRSYAIEYGHREEDGTFTRIGTWNTKAHDFEHALEKFHADDEGFFANRIACTEGKAGRTWEWTWHDVPYSWQEVRA